MESHRVFVATFMLILHLVQAQDQPGTYKIVVSIYTYVFFNGFLDYKIYIFHLLFH